VVVQAKVTQGLAGLVGRTNLSIGKTFGTLCSQSMLRSNIGGIADSNQTLTYRVLALTEGRPLHDSDQHEAMLATLANAYGHTHTAGHRLLSLATDISRYWRTLRIDYKHKVDEEKKPWAIRSLKLRSMRRLSYLASALHFVAFGPRCPPFEAMDVEKVREFMRAMSLPPCDRMIAAWSRIAGERAPLNHVLARYDTICGRLADKGTRDTLNSLDDARRRMQDETYKSIRLEVQRLHEQMADLVLAMPAPHQREMLEMFLL
jgi:hypothetical protein